MSTSDSSKRIRFTSDDDLCLLKQVLGQNPLTYPENWRIVQENMRSTTGKFFIIRTLKDHLFLLLDIWKKKTEADQKRSGVEEMYSERDKCLQEIADMCADLTLAPPPKKRRAISKEKQIIELGRKMRDNHSSVYIESETRDSTQLVEVDHSYVILPEHQAEEVVVENVVAEEVESMQNTPYIPRTLGKAEENKKQIMGPVKRRQNKSVLLRTNGLDYLNRKNEKDFNIRARELAIEEKKTELEERRLKLEEEKLRFQEKKWENEHNETKLHREFERQKMKEDLAEKKSTIALIESQTKIIESLLKRLQKYED
ncbi:uncharacterized protein [Diabrotica undecimpunctata]|uniref:uncharacterized protein n=1 Tax=Diabrotica undecimpunctata TaxID=50387 RepID=UPI003B633737